MSGRLNDRRRSLDDPLKGLILELQADTATPELHTSVKKAGSFVNVKSIEDYQRDRQCYLQTLLQVPQARPLRLQCDVLREECGTVCRKSEYTPENLPLLLHQFFCDRVSQLVQLKHLHLVRWARFALRKPRVAEELHQEHLRRMEWIMQEYNYSLNAARRLAISHDLMLSNRPPPSNLVWTEDALMYIRWLVFNQHVVKNVTAFVMTIRWIPLLYQQELSNTITKATTTTTTTNNKATPSHQPTPSDLGGTQAIPVLKGRHPHNQGLPKHSVNVSDICGRLEELKVAYSIVGTSNTETPSEHLQLYYHASRKFNEVFESQELQSVLHTYDKPAGAESIPAPSRTKLTFRKPANWTPFVQMKPHPDPVQIKSIVKMKEKITHFDTVLELSSHCTHLHSIQRALYALRQHMAAVRHPSTITPISVSSHKTPHSTLLVWRCIYSGLDTRNPISKETKEPSDDTDEEMETDPDGLGTPSGELGTGRGGRREASPVRAGERHSVGVSEAMKLIHAEDGRAVSAQANSVPKDGYFAYVLLRHLKIRDCRAKCLEILNYFRSVERTLTINCEGLSLESVEYKTSSGLLDHRHLFRTPADYIVSQSEFMQFMEVENHDDYYSFEGGDGHVRVRDHRGVHVVYDAALGDLDTVEKELLLVGSYYVQRGEAAAKTRQLDSQQLDIGAYSHQSVDCFAVLLDLWSCEERFLQAKLKVVNCYLEAYHHVYNPREKQVMSKVITDLLWLRPRHDLSAFYFTSAYEGECRCLAGHHHLIHTITSHQLSEERAHTQVILQQVKDAVPGLPHPPVLKQLVSLTGDKGTLVQSYLLEFCNSLSVLASVYAAVNWALTEIHHVFSCSGSGVIDLHCKVLELALQEWEQREGLGTSFTAEVQKHVFADVVVEDPQRMGEVFLGVCDEVMRGVTEQHMDVKEQDAAQMRGWVNILQLVTQRHHMIITCSECETLMRTYRLQLGCLDYEECHAHLRCVPFDAAARLGASRDLEYFLRQAREGGVQSRLDSYSPTRLHLAVHELDEKTFGNFSFRSKEGLLKILTSRSGLDDLKTTLAVQVAYRNALLIACQQNSVVLRSIGGDVLMGVHTSTLTGRHGSVDKKLVKCFVSIQLEKSPVRDFMLAQFTSHPAAAKNREELEESKSKVVNHYCDNLMMSLSHYSLRSQLLRYYESLHKLLEDFPATRKAYFIVGGGPEVGGGLEAPVYGSSVKPTDSRSYQSRLHMLLSADGKRLLNLWYIPSTIQILTMFSDLPLEDKVHALTVALHLISSLHDILAYLCTYVKLGTSQGPFRGDREFAGGWGGIERVGTEVQLLQNHIGQLNDSSDPWMVCEYLDYYRGILFLQHDVIVCHCLKRTLLLKDKTEAVQVLERVSQEAQECLRESPSRHLSFLLYPIPSPLDLPTQKPSSVFPWRAFFNSCGPFSSILQHCQNTSAYIYTSLAMLGPLDRSVANAEILGLALLMEDVVHAHTIRGSSTLDEKGSASHPPHFPTPLAGSNRSLVPRPLPPTTPSTLTGSTRDLSVGVTNAQRHQAPPFAGLGTATRDLSASQQLLLLPPSSQPLPSLGLLRSMPLMEEAKLLQRFLVKMSQVETLKRHWGLRVLGVIAVVTQKQCLLLEETYREKVMGVAQRVVAKRQAAAAKQQLENESTSGGGSMTTFVTEASADSAFGSEEGSDLPEKENLNELLLKEAQVKHLLQLLEQYLVDDTCKHLSKIHHLLMAERQRDDTTTLPLDLWKRSTMKDIVGLPRPHTVDDFLLELQKQLTEAGDVFTVPKAHLATCLSHLSSGVLAREKECYDMYASYYEAILKSQYHQIYLKNQEVEHYQWLAEANAKRTKQEDLLFMSEHTQSLILEITALRARVLELEDDLRSKEEVIRRRVLDEYTSLVDCMFSATMDVKGRFTDYRKSLYDDMVHSLYEVRQATAESIGKMKDRLSGGSSSHDAGALVHGLKGEGCKEIQQENASLSRMMVKRRALAGWNKTRSQQQHNQELLSLSTQLDGLRKEYFEMKMENEEKTLSLQQQVQALQKSLGQMETESEVVKQSLEEEKQKRVISGKLAASRAKESPMSKSEKSQGVKAEQLLQVLEEKDKVIQSLTAYQDRTRMQVAWDQSRASKEVLKMKQQLGHERALKLEAFHQVEDLMTQVHSYEAQHTSLVSSVNNLHPTSLSTTSVSRMTSARNTSPQLTRAQALKSGTSQGPRPRTGSMEKGDMIDLSEEILALRLI